MSNKLIYTNIHLASKYRDNYYNTSATNYTYTLPTTLKNVTSLKLSSICIPNTWYLISHKANNNRFIIELEVDNKELSIFEIVIPDGNYNDKTLQDYLNNNYFYNSETMNLLQHVKFEINENTLKSEFSLLETCDDSSKMSIKFVDDRTQSITGTFGWLIGFRYGQYLNIGDILMSEGLWDGGGDRYLYFCLKDFNKSTNTSNIVFFDKTELRSEDILAKIYMLDGKFGLNIDNEPDTVNNHTKTRKYFGPVDINRIEVKLLDEYGNVIDLNNMDFSFSLEISQKYNSY